MIKDLDEKEVCILPKGMDPVFSGTLVEEGDICWEMTEGAKYSWQQVPFWLVGLIYNYHDPAHPPCIARKANFPFIKCKRMQ